MAEPPPNTRTAILNGEPIPASDVLLDDLGWSHQREHGDAVLMISLDEEDLRYVGRRVMEHFREILDEDPEYFDDEGLGGEPVPTSEEIFVEHPEELSRYLIRAITWSRDTVTAILDRIAPDRKKGGAVLCLLVELREVRAGDRSAELLFGALTTGTRHDDAPSTWGRLTRLLSRVAARLR